MSYILDALRRAEAERERGAVPGLHGQTVTASAAADEARAPMPPWVWLAAGGALALVVVLVWRVMATEPVPVAAAPVAAAPAPPIAPAASAPLTSSTLRTASVAEVMAPRIDSPKTAAAPAPRSDAPVVQTLPPVVAAAPASAAAPRVYTMSELPDDVRRQWPALTVGGSIDSPDPASRVLILNGQLFHEKDTVLPDLTVVQIRLKDAVLQFRGYRVRMAY